MRVGIRADRIGRVAARWAPGLTGSGVDWSRSRSGWSRKAGGKKTACHVPPKNVRCTCSLDTLQNKIADGICAGGWGRFLID